MVFRNGQLRLPSGIDQWIVARKLKIELILALLSLVAILIHSFEKEIGGEIMMITMSSLAAFYFILGHTTPDVVSRFSRQLFGVISITASVSIIGLLFSIMRMDGSEEMIMVGLIGMLLSGLIVLSYVLTQWDDKLRPLLFRTVVLTVLMALAYFKLITF
jgi:hypothetical protein